MKRGSLLVAQVDPPCWEFQGDHYYRTYVPLRATAEADPSIYCVAFTNENRLRNEIFFTADVLILTMIGDIDLLPMIKKRQQMGLITVYEWNDDVFHVPPWNHQYRYFASPRTQEMLETLANACDAVQYSTNKLYEIYGYLHRTKIVFENQMMFVPPSVTTSSDDKKTVIGYGGSSGHFYDVAYVAIALTEWMSRRKDVCLHVMAPPNIWHLFSGIPEGRKRYFPTGTITEYYNFLRTLDIGLGPLQDIPFNRSRSDIKFLEYAAFGVVPVMQATYPYTKVVINGHTGFLFNTNKELIKILDNLVDNPKLRKKVSEKARNYVLSKRIIKKHIHTRISFYRNLGNKKGKSFRPKKQSAIPTFFDFLTSQRGAIKKGNFVLLGPSPYEFLLRKGLELMAEGQLESARKCFNEAMKLEPHDYFPYLLAAEAEEDPLAKRELLKQAWTLNPHSIMIGKLME